MKEIVESPEPGESLRSLEMTCEYKGCNSLEGKDYIVKEGLEPTFRCELHKPKKFNLLTFLSNLWKKQ